MKVTKNFNRVKGHTCISLSHEEIQYIVQQYFQKAMDKKEDSDPLEFEFTWVEDELSLVVEILPYNQTPLPRSQLMNISVTNPEDIFDP